MLEKIIFLVSVALLVVPVAVPLLQSFAIAGAKVTPLDQAKAQATFAGSRSIVDEKVLTELGFTRDGAYLVDLNVGKAVFAMWRLGHESTYAAAYAMAAGDGGQWHLDFVTVLKYDPVFGVTTGDAKDTHTTLSMPGWYKQSFGDRTTRVMWDLHNHAEMWIVQQHSIEAKATDLNCGQVLDNWLRHDAKYAITHPWRFLAVPYRYWVGRHLRHGKTVAELYG